MKNASLSCYKKSVIAATVKKLLYGQIILSSCFTIGAYADPTIQRFLDPSVETYNATIDDCIEAAPSSLFLISKAGGQYHISQITDHDQQRNYYQVPVNMQIIYNQITATKLCHGVASISNTFLPFVSVPNSYNNENDAILFLNATKPGFNEIADILTNMQSLAVKASSGVYSSTQLSNFDVTFQNLMSQIDTIAYSRTYNGTYLLSSTDPITITNSQGSQNFTVWLPNLTTGSSGLHLGSLNLASNADAQMALMTLTNLGLNYQAEYSINDQINNLTDSTSSNEIITQIDLTTNQISKKTVALKKNHLLLPHKNTHHADANKVTKPDKKMLVHGEECITADNGCMLNVTPQAHTHNVYQITQTCGYNDIRYYYTDLIPDQVDNRSFLGIKFCKGILSTSNMQVPLMSSNLNEAGGHAIADTILTDTKKISDLLNQIQQLANTVTSSTTEYEFYNLNTQMQAYINEINRIAWTTSFGDIKLLNQNYPISIKIGQDQTVFINTVNLSADSTGLGIDSLNLLSYTEAQKIISIMKNKISYLTSLTPKYETLNKQFSDAMKQNEKIATADISSDVLVFQEITAL